MKARTKITIWTSSFTLVVALCFSFFVFYEIGEQPLRIIDRDIRDIGGLVIQRISSHSYQLQSMKVLTEHPFDRYYIKVVDGRDTVRLVTPMTSHVDLPARSDEKLYFVKKDIDRAYLSLTAGDRKELEEEGFAETPFRVLRKVVTRNKQTFTLLIGLPVPILELEMYELITQLVIWLGIAIVLVIISSYYLAGGILKPLSRINVMIREISDVSLDKRLPVGKNRDELRTLAVSLNSMFDKLQFSFDRQKEYIGSASHELKTPLTVLMLGHEKMLQEDVPEKIRSQLGRQLDSLRRLTKMVRNLLEISRLEQHESFHPERIDIVPLVQHIVEEFEDILMSKGIKIHMDLEPCMLPADREKILQMLINLLDNAIKYNVPSDGQIWVSASPTQGGIEISVTNTGKNIPEESLEKIFEQFYRVEKSRAVTFGGAGLGLAIVKQIVTLHHGSIVAKTTSTGTNQFIVRLPSTAI